MALIDTSELMYDPDFVDTVQLITRVSAIDDKGRNQLTESAPVDVLMSVQGPSAEDFQRFPDLANLHGVRAVWYNGTFSMNGANEYTDVVLWQGRRYQIYKVDEDYTNFGGGFSKAFMVAVQQ